MKTTIPMRRGIRVFLLLSFIFFMGNINSMFAQDNFYECAALNPTEAELAGSTPHITNISYFENLNSIVFNVYFWGINQDNGNSSNKLTEIDALYGIAVLNKKYNQFNIIF